MTESGAAGDEASLVELQRMASSSSFAARATAGVALVARVSDPSLSDVLIRLLLDTEDTFVTQEVSAALLSRGDRPALRLYAKGWFQADRDQIEHFADPARSVQPQFVFWNELAADTDHEVATGALDILSWINRQHRR